MATSKMEGNTRKDCLSVSRVYLQIYEKLNEIMGLSGSVRECPEHPYVCPEVSGNVREFPRRVRECPEATASFRRR